MKKLIEARDSKVAELDGLLEELDEMTEGEEFDGKLARSKDLHVEIKDLEETYILMGLMLGKNKIGLVKLSKLMVFPLK